MTITELYNEIISKYGNELIVSPKCRYEVYNNRGKQYINLYNSKQKDKLERLEYEKYYK